ncbi:hypothetical protein R1flu_020329 [Riccia fluitans]|uniref:Uncharacterized protein n=1 Tax=Riccia fluitans TaxID=41844 RepID=A0ABD1ZL75_9MARC
MARYSDQMVAVVKHWTMEKADGRTDALTSVRPSVVTLAKFFLNQISQVPGLTIPAPATDCIDELQVLCATVASWAGDLKQEVAEDRQTRSILTERANGAQAKRDAARQKYKLSNSIADHRAEEAKKRVQERDEELRQAQDELRRAREELAQTRADGKKQSRALEEELRRVWNDVVQWEKKTSRWIRNDEKMADFVQEIARLREELLTKDAKMRELEKILRERPEEIQPGQIESAQKEFHDVEQRFALVESPDLRVGRSPAGKGEIGRPGAGVIRPAGSGPAATRAVSVGEEGGGHTDTELATQLKLAQLQLEKVQTKADLEAAFADLDTVQA